MPIKNSENNILIFFSGENYAEKKEVEILKRRGQTNETFNAKYLIHAYEKKGRDRFLKWLNGWFSGVIIDFIKKKIVLFNDRYGLGRIYYYAKKENFYFSSEAKAILNVCPSTRTLDKKCLAQYLSFGCVINNKTLFSNISLLPPGSSWCFYEGNKIKKVEYFKPSEWENDRKLDKEGFYEKFRETFTKVLPKYFIPNFNIGFSLTGGLDTRMILACCRALGDPMPCYTFGGISNDIYDIKIAEQVAKICGQKHYVIRLDEKFFNEFESLASKIVLATDGNSDICGTHEIYLNSIARKISPVRMTGNFGGEVLRGVSTFKPIPLSKAIFNNDFNKLIMNEREALKKLHKGHKVSFTVFKEIPWKHSGMLSAAGSQLTIRSPYLDNDLIRLLYRQHLGSPIDNDKSLRLIRENNQRLASVLTDQGVGGNMGKITSFAIKGYHRFLFKAEYLLNDGMPQALAKISNLKATSALEKIFLGKNKYLFYRKWFKNELSDYIQSILTDSRTEQRAFTNKKFIRKMLKEHLRGKANYTDEISKLITIELIHRLLLEKK